MGARIALEALLYYGAPFLSLTCISTSLEISNKKERRKIESLWAENLNTLSTEDFIHYWYSQALFKGFNPPSIRYTQNKVHLLKVLHEYSSLHTPPLIDKISSCKIPIQFIYKEHDPKARAVWDHKKLTFYKSVFSLYTSRKSIILHSTH